MILLGLAGVLAGSAVASYVVALLARRAKHALYGDVDNVVRNWKVPTQGKRVAAVLTGYALVSLSKYLMFNGLREVGVPITTGWLPVVEYSGAATTLVVFWFVCKYPVYFGGYDRKDHEYYRTDVVRFDRWHRLQSEFWEKFFPFLDTSTPGVSKK